MDPLLAILDDPEVQVRFEVVHVFWTLHDARAVMPLIAQLQKGNETYRRQVVQALGKQKDPRAVAPLIDLFKESAISCAAISSVRCRTSPDKTWALISRNGKPGNRRRRSKGIRTSLSRACPKVVIVLVLVIEN